jgi:hypothetical protein
VPITIEGPELIVTPSTATVPAGGTKQYISTYYSNGKAKVNGQDVTNYSAWTVNDPTIATIQYATGLATGKKAGTTQIKAEYAGLTGKAEIIVTQPATPGGTNTPGSLKLQAYSQRAQDIYGNWHDPEARTPGTAKWTDSVTATLTLPVHSKLVEGDSAPNYKTTVAPPEPPTGGCNQNYSVIKSWRITNANINYPKQNPDFTFGSPEPPVGTVTEKMTVNGNQATGTFKELWALDGAPIYDMLNNRDVGPPKNYTITASNITVEVTYEIHRFHLECDPEPDGQCYCVESVSTGKQTQSINPVSAQLLVNGSGVNSLAQ